MKLTIALAASLLLSTAASAQSQFNILVNDGNNLDDDIGAQRVSDIYSGAITLWDDVPGSHLTGQIEALGLPESHPATQAFETAVGLAQYGTNVTIFSGSFAPRILAIVVANLVNGIAVNDPSQALFPGEHTLRIDY